MTTPESRPQRKIGRVVSDKMTGSVVVAVQSERRHPLYQKASKRTTRLIVHDPDNTWHIGDTVMIEAGRPFSRRKSWRIVSGQAATASSPAAISDEQAVAEAA